MSAATIFAIFIIPVLFCVVEKFAGPKSVDGRIAVDKSEK